MSYYLCHLYSRYQSSSSVRILSNLDDILFQVHQISVLPCSNILLSSGSRQSQEASWSPHWEREEVSSRGQEDPGVKPGQPHVLCVDSKQTIIIIYPSNISRACSGRRKIFICIRIFMLMINVWYTNPTIFYFMFIVCKFDSFVVKHHWIFYKIYGKRIKCVKKSWLVSEPLDDIKF